MNACLVKQPRTRILQSCTFVPFAVHNWPTNSRQACSSPRARVLCSISRRAALRNLVGVTCAICWPSSARYAYSADETVDAGVAVESQGAQSICIAPDDGVATIDPCADEPTVTERAELWVKAGLGPARRVEIALYGCVTPRTVANFCALVTSGDYDGSTVYRVVPGLTVQMGDVLKNGGTSGRSAQPGGIPLDAENYRVRHACAGVVSMARDRDGRADSRFFVATRPGDSAYLDDRYVAFGRVTHGLEVLTDLDRFAAAANAPRVLIVLERCRLLGKRTERVV